MIDPARQWAIQIEVTNACPRGCANCTRMVGHSKPFFMTPVQAAWAAHCLRDFLKESPPAANGEPRKCVGVLGGEPLIHPQFREICEAVESEVPDRYNRGLWTARKWQETEYADLIERVFGYVNNNTHEGAVVHSPVLVAIEDVISDREEMWRIIDRCWLQEKWSGSINPKGFFFCEVAAAMDVVFDGPGGLAVEPGCWRRPISDFRDQIERWCPRCGIALQLPGRPDTDFADDVSQSNLDQLGDSPRIHRGRYKLYVPQSPTAKTADDQPWRYMR